MLRATSSAPRLAPRPLASLRLTGTLEGCDEGGVPTGEDLVFGLLGGRPVQLKCSRRRGTVEFLDGAVERYLSEAELKDVVAALAELIRATPWEDPVAGRILKAATSALYPTLELGRTAWQRAAQAGDFVILSGRCGAYAVEVWLHRPTGALSMVSSGTHQSVRPVSTREREALRRSLASMVTGTEPAWTLYADVLEAVGTDLLH